MLRRSRATARRLATYLNHRYRNDVRLKRVPPDG